MPRAARGLGTLVSSLLLPETPQLNRHQHALRPAHPQVLLPPSSPPPPHLDRHQHALPHPAVHPAKGPGAQHRAQLHLAEGLGGLDLRQQPQWSGR